LGRKTIFKKFGQFSVLSVQIDQHLVADFSGRSTFYLIYAAVQSASWQHYRVKAELIGPGAEFAMSVDINESHA
jgi:hypothetical protein